MSEKRGRNDPCPCGSGKKHKRCCLGMEPPASLPTAAGPQDFPFDRPGAPAPPLPAIAPPPKPPPRLRDEWDDWYDRYHDAAPAAKLEMLRALLAEGHPAEFYEKLDFVSLLLDLPRDLGHGSGETVLAFLEELLATHPEVFNLGAEWLVRDMAHAYMTRGRERDIARLLPCVLDEAHKMDDPLFDVLDLIRMAGLYDESRRLVMAMLKKVDKGEYMPWAVDDLLEYAIFFIYQDAFDAGSRPEAMDKLRQQFAEIRCNPTDEHLVPMIAHRLGTTDRQFVPRDFLGRSDSARFNLYLLTLDFGRWLNVERGIPPLVADTMRHFVGVCLAEMRQKSDRNPFAWRKERLEKYVASLLGFMSLMHLRAVATLIAMRHFSDFLAATNLIPKNEYRHATRMCDELWAMLPEALGDTAPAYAFLNRYLVTADAEPIPAGARGL